MEEGSQPALGKLLFAYPGPVHTEEPLTDPFSLSKPSSSAVYVSACAPFIPGGGGREGNDFELQFKCPLQQVQRLNAVSLP